MAKQALTKKANLEIAFTEEMLLDLERCSRHGISEDYGIVYFCRKYVKIQHPTLGIIPFDIRDYQIKMLDCYMYNRWSIVLTARQSGKTEASALFLLWTAMFTPNMKILVASRIAKDAKDIMKRVKFMYENLPDFLRPGIDEYNVHTVSFDNGSEIYSEATTPDTGRGRSISLLYLDELARVRPKVAEEFWASIMPTLTTGGKCIITSTPGTDTDTFSTIWHGAKAEQNGFAYVEVSWKEVPETDGSVRGKKFREDTISRIGLLKWRREYNNEFLSDAETLISALRMQNWKEEPPRTIKNSFKFWDKLTKQKYVIGVDVGTGTGGDFSTIEVFSFPQLVQVAELRENTMSTPQLTKRLVWMLQLIAKAGGESYYSVENNGVGEGVIAAIELIEEEKNIEIPGEMFHESGKGKRGYYTSNKKKLGACMNLKNLLDTDNPKMTIKSSVLITEFKFYVRTATAFAARLGITDDAIAACIIAVRVIDDIMMTEDGDYSSLSEDEDLEEWDDDDEAFGIIC